MQDLPPPGAGDGRFVAVLVAIVWLLASLFWWMASGVWMEVIENPPDDSWRLEDDPWQAEAMMWCDGGAAAIALIAIAVAARARRPLIGLLLCMVLGVGAQVIGLALLRSGGIF